MIARSAKARPEITSRELEPMLSALEHGRLDLVVAWFEKTTPWQSRVSLAPPIATMRTPDGATLELRSAARNGENRWIMTVERASRDVVPAVAQ